VSKVLIVNDSKLARMDGEGAEFFSATPRSTIGGVLFVYITFAIRRRDILRIHRHVAGYTVAAEAVNADRCVH